MGLGTGTDTRIDLIGTVFDKAGNTYTPHFVQSFTFTNFLPGFDFELERDRYAFNETLTLNETWVEDGDGFADIDRIDVQLRFDGNKVIDIPDITAFTPDPNDDRRGTFDYTLDFATLDLDLNNYDFSIEAIIYDRAGNGIKTGEQNFRLTNTIPSFDFHLSQSEYLPHETLTVTDSWVEDLDGFANLDRVNFLLRNLDNGTAIDVTDVTNLTADPNNSQRGTFNYSLNLWDWGLNSGNYELQGIAYDRQENPSVTVMRSFTIAPPENAPQNLAFRLDRNTYTPNATISLNNGWVKDEDGGNDITRIALRLLDANKNIIADLEEISNLAIATWSPQWASFNTQIDLNGFNLSEGTYTISGIAYDMNQNASNAFERNFYLDVPQNQFNPGHLQFNLDKNRYNATDTLQIHNGWVSDGDGAEDINRVEFKLVANDGTEIFLGAIDRLTQVSWSPEWASFNQSFDLTQFSLNEGTYTLVGVAYDNAGQQSNRMERRFSLEVPQVNQEAPTGLQFGLNSNSFSSNDTIEIINGWVSDGDGNRDLERVTFEIVAEDGTVMDVSNSLNLTAATWDVTQQWSSFHHRIDLSGLGLSGGRYTLRGKAYDRSGHYSNAFSRMFAIA